MEDLFEQTLVKYDLIYEFINKYTINEYMKLISICNKLSIKLLWFLFENVKESHNYFDMITKIITINIFNIQCPPCEKIFIYDESDNQIALEHLIKTLEIIKEIIEKEKIYCKQYIFSIIFVETDVYNNSPHVDPSLYEHDYAYEAKVLILASDLFFMGETLKCLPKTIEHMHSVTKIVKYILDIICVQKNSDYLDILIEISKIIIEKNFLFETLDEIKKINHEKFLLTKMEKEN